MAAPFPDIEALSKVIQSNCEVKGESPQLNLRPWFLSKKINERTSAVLLQLLHDSERRTALFAAMSARHVLSAVNAKETSAEVRMLIAQEREEVVAAMTTLDEFSIATSSVTFTLDFIGEGPDLTAEVKIGDVSYFLTQGVEVHAELELGDPVLLAVCVGDSVVGEQLLDLEPKSFSAASLLESPSLSFKKEALIAGVRVYLTIALSLNAPTKKNLLRLKLHQLDEEAKQIGLEETDYTEVLAALDVKIIGSEVKSTIENTPPRQQVKSTKPKVERDCDCCLVF